MILPRPATVEMAKRYPFPRPGHSFLFVDGDALPLLSLDEALEDAAVAVEGRSVPAGEPFRRRGIGAVAPLSRRTPVLAYGANAAPERLRLKYAPLAPAVLAPAVFPVVQAKLHGFDIVHAAHVSSYGAVPATIEASPGTVCDIAVTWLDERQLARMHETELRRRTYRFGLLRGIRLEPVLLPAAGAVSSYVGRHGHIIAPEGALEERAPEGALEERAPEGASVVTAPEGAPVALAAIGAVGRRFRALSQSDVQRAIQAMLGAPGPLDAFIHAAVADDAVRRERTERLREQARPFSYADFLPTAE